MKLRADLRPACGVYRADFMGRQLFGVDQVIGLAAVALNVSGYRLDAPQEVIELIMFHALSNPRAQDGREPLRLE